MKTALSIAGSDCSGGAGIQADLKTFAAFGVYGMSAIVAVVAENTVRVIDIQDVRPDLIEKQIDAVFEDIRVDAVKVGMLSSPECMRAVAGRLQLHAPRHVVIDPVMYAKNGAPLMREDAVGEFIKTVLPLGTVLTPNIPEAAKLSGLDITGQEDMKEAARVIHSLGGHNVVIKGGHASGAATDILFNGSDYQYFTAERINTKNTHGTGCTYSSAITAGLALGFELTQAVAHAKSYVTNAIKHAPAIGRGHGPVHHFYDLHSKNKG
jgi:hydroxymethylpyrimidine/phosphomethylpyrimidine kinase